MSRIPNTPPSHQHRERRVPLSKIVRAGLAQKSSLAQRKKAISLPPAPWINKEKTRHAGK
jgi:hypothetical protein